MSYRALTVSSGDALFLPAPPRRGSSRFWVSGAKVAEAGYYKALLEHGVLDSLDFFENGLEAEHRFRHAGKACRRLPVLDLPEQSRRRSYDAVMTEFSEFEVWSVRGRYLPKASVIAVMHAMSMQFSLVKIGAAMLWDLYRPYDAMVCASETSRRTMEAMFDHLREKLARIGHRRRPRLPRLTTIPWGVDIPRRPPPRAAARRSLGFGRDDVVVLSFGRLTLTDKADFVAMLVPLARLARKVRPLAVRVVVAGADQDGLARILRRLAGPMGLGRALSVHANPDYEMRTRLYAAADVFLSLSDNIQETFGLTLLEAMAHGLPVVASDWGGYRDIVEPGATGLLVRTLWARSFEDLDSLACVMDHREVSFRLARQTSVDPEGVEAALSRLVREPALRRGMGQAGLERVRRRYAWPVVAREHRKLWRELEGLRRRAPGPAAAVDLPGSHDHAAIFGHYPSADLCDGLRIVSTEDESASERANPVFQTAGKESSAALEAAARAAAGPEGATAGRCCAAVEKAVGISRREARAALALGLKYGVLREAR